MGITRTGAEIWRDYATEGVPASGAHAPIKSQIRQWTSEAEAILAALGSYGGAVYSTKAELNADLAWPANTQAWVVADGTSANNGVYRKSGGVGAGSWAKVADLPTGGGGGGATIYPGAGRYRTTRDTNVGWFSHLGNASATVAGISSATFVPVIVGADGNYDNLTVYCAGAAAGQTVRAALYAAAADNLIGALAIDFGSATLDASGFKTMTAGTPVALAAGLYYAIVQVSGGSPTFRGGTECATGGSGIIGAILYAAGIGRIVYLAYGTSWPSDMTSFAIGTGTDQIQLVGGFFAPAVLVR